MFAHDFGLGPGMVLIRSDSGQLMLVSQQTLAQAQGQEATQGGVQARGGEVLQGQPGGAQQRLDALQGEVLYYSSWRQKEGDG